MRPLVEATVFDETGAMGAAFFNQPWLVERYRPGTRLLLHGKARTRGALRGRQPRARRRARSRAICDRRRAIEDRCTPDPAAPACAAGQAIAHYPAAEGVSSTQIATLVREHRGALADVAEPLPARMRAAEHLPDRAATLAAMHFPRSTEEAEAGRARLAFEELLLMQLALLRRRALRGSGTAVAARRPARADRALAGGAAAVRGPPPTSAPRSPRSTRTSRERARCSAC